MFPGRSTRPIRLNEDTIGRADGRTIHWGDATVLVDGEPVTGLSLSCARDDGFGAKLICPERAFAIGDRVRVSIAYRDGVAPE